GGLPGVGGLPESLSFSSGSTGIRVFASPPCRRLFRLPSSKVHANRNSLSFPLHSSMPPVTTAPQVVVPLRSIDLVLSPECRTEDQFHFEEKLTWQAKPNPSRLSELDVSRPRSGRTTRIKVRSTT